MDTTADVAPLAGTDEIGIASAEAPAEKPRAKNPRQTYLSFTCETCHKPTWSTSKPDKSTLGTYINVNGKFLQVCTGCAKGMRVERSLGSTQKPPPQKLWTYSSPASVALRSYFKERLKEKDQRKRLKPGDPYRTLVERELARPPGGIVAADPTAPSRHNSLRFAEERASDMQVDVYLRSHNIRRPLLADGRLPDTCGFDGAYATHKSCSYNRHDLTWLGPSFDWVHAKQKKEVGRVKLAEAIRKGPLPPESREISVRVLVNGQTIKAVANVMGLPYETARRRLNAADASLALELGFSAKAVMKQPDPNRAKVLRPKGLYDGQKTDWLRAEETDAYLRELTAEQESKVEAARPSGKSSPSMRGPITDFNESVARDNSYDEDAPTDGKRGENDWFLADMIETGLHICNPTGGRSGRPNKRALFIGRRRVHYVDTHAIEDKPENRPEALWQFGQVNFARGVVKAYADRMGLPRKKRRASYWTPFHEVRRVRGNVATTDAPPNQFGMTDIRGLALALVDPNEEPVRREKGRQAELVEHSDDPGDWYLICDRLWPKPSQAKSGLNGEPAAAVLTAAGSKS